jgi:hypothetical protein
LAAYRRGAARWAGCLLRQVGHAAKTA